MWIYFAGLVAIFFLIKLYFVHSHRWCWNKVCLVGKTVLITGANTGIGFEAALEFAKRGARVILACRNEEKANEAKEKIVKLTRNENVHVKLVNMVSLESVRQLADDILKNEDRLDILVNNAGAAGLKHKKTEDGLQVMMQINYFSPFLLTYLLLGLLKKSKPTRIVNVSSLLACHAELDVNNLNRSVGIGGDYSNSKLCNILFTKELARRLEGSGVTSYSLHPGAVETEIFRRISVSWRKIAYRIISLYFKTPEQGAQTTIYVATQPGIEHLSGRHFEECSVVTDYRAANKPELPKKLWEATIELLNIKEKTS